jgi:membrane protein required for colicin V production
MYGGKPDAMIYAPLDIAFTMLILIITVRAALHGFVEELFGVAWLILGLLFAINFYKAGADYIRTKILQDVKILPEVLAFIGLFLIVFIVVKIITFILKDIINRIKLGGLDHFLGVLFGVVEGLLAVALVIFIINIQPLFDGGAVLKNSVYNRFLSGNITSAYDALKKQPFIDPADGIDPANIIDTEAR